MQMLWLLAFVAAASVAAFLVLRGRRPAVPLDPPSSFGAPPTAGGPLSHPTLTPPSARVALDRLPPVLEGLRIVDADSLAAERQRAVVEVFAKVPRPPRLLSQLVSAEFVNGASAAELADLVAGEPVIAARVLAAVNSPFYGLARPVASIGQAVTVLGLNTVRAIGLQYVLLETFRADSPDRVQLLQATWNAGALASELCQQPLQRLALGDGGGTTSAVVLSFLGRLAVAAAVPRGLLDRIPPRDLVQRLQSEQATLGLSSGQIGRLLMRQWALPEGIVEAAASVDRVLLRPWQPGTPLREARQAFGYVCARLGEQLAWGEIDDPAAFDLATADSPEWLCARSYLDEPLFAALVGGLQEPTLLDRLRAMQTTMRSGTLAA